MPGNPDPKLSLALAKAAATEAGRFLAARGSKSVVVENHRRDVKLDVDRAAEELIVKILKESALPILTEEAGWVGANTSAPGLHWIVDPLDGTMNFLRGIPLSCVSIALWKENEPVLGVVYNFIDQEMFIGVIGEGAWLSDKSLKVSDTKHAKDSVLFTGFPVGGDFSSKAVQDFVGQVIRYKKIRSIGSAALSLAYVAAGRGDLYYERDVKIWDVAAGLALVQAAGGKITAQSSPKAHSVTVWAGNPHLEHNL